MKNTEPEFGTHFHRMGLTLEPDPSRVLLRPFRSGNRKRILEKVAEYVSALTDEKVDQRLSALIGEFGHRHANVEGFFINRFARVNKNPRINGNLTRARKALIGSYFCHEYSIEAAALFNPSIVKHPDQSNLNAGGLRFIVSLRATGEGHISSITFRTGTLEDGNRIHITPPAEPLVEPRPSNLHDIEKALFIRKLAASNLLTPSIRRLMEPLPDFFLIQDLLNQIQEEPSGTYGEAGTGKSLVKKIKRLALSDREVVFDPGTSLTQRVLFPFTAEQRNGIEDARFVEFQDENGEITYYATYTAFDGKHIRPRLFSTKDFRRFQFLTLFGPGISNKGMSLFPRKIDGRFVMLARQDDRNIMMMSSDDIQFWGKPRMVIEPRNAWEMLKIGTCSSPLETKAGWLVLSHGVGPMRTYGIGAFLLDIREPSRVLGRLNEPLIVPNESEREGYVPNVLYTCGALLHEEKLIIPYAASDSSTLFAMAELDDILNSMT